MYLYPTPLRYPIGTKLRVLSIPIHHEGTYVGPVGEDGEDVVHSDKPEGVILSHFAEFAEHWPVETVNIPSSPEQGEEIVQRALETLGIPYDLRGVNGLNCEQAANYHQRGEAVSPTLRVVTGALVLGGLAGLAWLAGTEKPRTRPKLHTRRPTRTPQRRRRTS